MNDQILRRPRTGVYEGAREMTELVYSAITSIDGYVADADGNFDWTAPDEEVPRFRERPGATDRHVPLWPSQLKISAARNLTIGGPALAAEAIAAGLVDDYHLFIAP
jgi:hypothetical protein